MLYFFFFFFFNNNSVNFFRSSNKILLGHMCNHLNDLDILCDFRDQRLLHDFNAFQDRSIIIRISSGDLSVRLYSIANEFDALLGFLNTFIDLSSLLLSLLIVFISSGSHLCV